MPTQNSLLGAAGEHYVLSCLLRRGYTAGFAPLGTPAIDIMVYDGRCQVHRNIQVKTRNPNRPDGAWVMGRKHETPIAGLFFCLVSLPEMEDGRHDVYVMPSDVVAAVLLLDHRLWLGRPGRNGQAHRVRDLDADAATLRVAGKSGRREVHGPPGMMASSSPRTAGGTRHWPRRRCGWAAAKARGWSGSGRWVGHEIASVPCRRGREAAAAGEGSSSEPLQIGSHGETKGFKSPTGRHDHKGLATRCSGVWS